jgi:chromate reductase
MTFHLLGLSGSLREGSHNSAILLTLAENLAGRANLAVHRLNDVPLYNGDYDAPAPIPAPVVALRSAVAEVDGVIVASPEYNYGMSGVIKNALDWLSCPYGDAALAGKPVLDHDIINGNDRRRESSGATERNASRDRGASGRATPDRDRHCA